MATTTLLDVGALDAETFDVLLSGLRLAAAQAYKDATSAAAFGNSTQSQAYVEDAARANLLRNQLRDLRRASRTGA